MLQKGTQHVRKALRYILILVIVGVLLILGGSLVHCTLYQIPLLKMMEHK